MVGLGRGRRLRFGYTAVGYSTARAKACEPYHCIGYKGDWDSTQTTAEEPDG